MRSVCMMVAAALALSVPAYGQSPWPEGAEVYIVAPADGAAVQSPVRVVFGLRGMGVAPAGVDHPNTGHHHLLVDTGAPEGEDLSYALPAEDTLIHFGGGQTETVIELPPGEHTLQLLVGDANHIPHDPPLISERITVQVVE